VPKKIIVNVNSAWNLFNFRAGLIVDLIEAGYEVVAVAPSDDNVPKLELLGCRFVNLEMDNQGTNPFRGLLLLWRYWRLLLNEKPDLCLFYTVKPNIFGSLASTFCGVPFINNVAGLGSVFISGGWLKRVVQSLYKIALRNSIKVFFQNKDDLELFLENKLINPKLADVVPGSGINLNYFSPVKTATDTTENSSFKFLLIARMLKDKGVVEYVQAAQMLKESGFKAEFCLLGFLDVQNPAAISTEQMNAWVKDGFVNYLGSSDDVREHISNANCIVLPSYREGTPRSLLEAAAMAKPIITTDAVGCKEVVVDGENGMFCEVKSSADLASKMKQMLMLTEEQRRLMGQKGRLKMEKEYDEKIVIQKYLQTIELALKDPQAP
jgi:glycosyltransferase involved in cell wall biosynthesis